MTITTMEDTTADIHNFSHISGSNLHCGVPVKKGTSFTTPKISPDDSQGIVMVYPFMVFRLNTKLVQID